jgi:hypothetical protein
VHRLVEMRAGNVDIAAARLERALRRDEPVAGRMRLQPADVGSIFSGRPKRCPRM